MQITHRLVRLAAAIVVATALTTPVSAQSLTFGELSGIVLDPDGTPIANVNVRARDQASGAPRFVRTARDGRFRFGVLAAGRYQVLAEALGFHPMVITDVEVAAGHSANVTLRLRRAVPPVTTIDTVRSTAGASSGHSWLQDRGLVDLVGTRRTLGDAALLSTTADELGVEGLPWRMAGLVVDGTRAFTHGAPGGDGSEATGLAFPSRGLGTAAVGGLGFDVETGGTGVGLRATTLRGGRDTRFRGGAEGGAALYGAHAIVGGELQGDTTHALAGIDYQRNEVRRPSMFGDATALAAAYVGASALLAPYADEATRLDERWSGFGRLDFQPHERFAIGMRASGSRLTSRGLAESFGAPASLGSDYEAVGVHAAVNVLARLSARFTQEIRISADVADATSRMPLLPRTTLAGAGLTVGAGRGEPFDDARTTPRVSALLHGDLGAHLLKLGFALGTHRIDASDRAASAGELVYGDPTDLANGSGVFRRLEPAVPAGDFSMTELAFFVQDAWTIANGLSVSIGARWDGTTIPDREIEPNAGWLAVSGIDNRLRESPGMSFSPRLGLRWQLGRDWLIEGGAGIFQELPDSRDVAEALTFDRSTPVRYASGSATGWPGVPNPPVVGSTLTMLGRDFQGPRTRRLSLGISHQRGAWTGFANGVYRHTDFLARRRDINLPALPAGSDQHGRPRYGDLVQLGSVLAVAPSTNRRFTEFDAVHVLEASGFSDYWGLTLGLERVQDRGLSLGLRYTFSRTRDNVPGLGYGPRLSPFPGGLDGTDWDEGISDLDIPHRLLAATEWSVGAGGALRLGVVYRLQSGLPYTPGLRAGVDANGDGSWRNDPAFVDPSIPGIVELLEAHPCLRESALGFAARNSCRDELQHRVDARASIRIMETAAGRLDLVLDALDVTAAARGPVDDALFLVDRTGTLSTSPFSGITTVPYVANPNFGRRLADRSPGMLWRVGVRITP